MEKQLSEMNDDEILAEIDRINTVVDKAKKAVRFLTEEVRHRSLLKSFRDKLSQLPKEEKERLLQTLGMEGLDSEEEMGDLAAKKVN